ncbi:TetR/AcrR family transcriptional regulator [Phyllobacterium sp. SB3]|uniref:TetR/AcrR family transcriptional regulator n=1 Tax=Phyllobacterium sp. SB3 TaxID=3156073 RepID=UPI0032AFD171
MKTADTDKEMTSDAPSSMRADARRNVDALLEAARSVFTESGVDTPIRTIAAKAGVGVGTVYRHFPQRSDLIKAIIQREVAAQVEAAETLSKNHKTGEALALWMSRLIEFVGTKRGLGPALHSGDPAYQSLPDFVLGQLTPALHRLLKAAAISGDVRDDVDANDLLNAGLRLATPTNDGDTAQAKRMIALLVDGLRYSPSGTSGEV